MPPALPLTLTTDPRPHPSPYHPNPDPDPDAEPDPREEQPLLSYWHPYSVTGTPTQVQQLHANTGAGLRECAQLLRRHGGDARVRARVRG